MNNQIKISRYKIGEEGIAYIKGRRLNFVIQGNDNQQYLNFYLANNDIIFEMLGYNTAYSFYNKYHIPYSDEDGIWPYTYSLTELKKVITLINGVLSDLEIKNNITIY